MPIFFVIVAVFAGGANSISFLGLHGPYLGQKPPGDQAEVFAPGIISMEEEVELNAVFSLDGKEFYFTRLVAGQLPRTVIMVSQETSNGWSKPWEASFSGEYNDIDMALSPNNEFLYFCSKRPLPGQIHTTNRWHIWCVSRTAQGWSEPRPVIVSDGQFLQGLHPSQALNGKLFFQSNLDGGFGGSDLWWIKPLGSTFSQPKNVGARVNSRFGEGDLCVDQAERFIIFVAYNRPDSFGEGDLYLSRRDRQGNWGMPLNLGPKVNTAKGESSPMMTPDGQYLFFGRFDPSTTKDAIYWISTDFFKPLISE